MERSESIDLLATALAKVQAQIGFAKQSGKNPHFKSDYSTLADVWEACRKPLSEEGLAVIQLVGNAEDGVKITTMLAHSSGQWIAGHLVIPVSQVSAQAIGSAITYGRRYGLSAMVGIAPADDDGNEAEAAKPTQAPSSRVEQRLPYKPPVAGSGPAVPTSPLVQEAQRLGATVEEPCPRHPDIALTWYEPKGKTPFWGHAPKPGEPPCRFSPMELSQVRARKGQEVEAPVEEPDALD